MSSISTSFSTRTASSSFLAPEQRQIEVGRHLATSTSDQNVAIGPWSAAPVPNKSTRGSTASKLRSEISAPGAGPMSPELSY